MKDKFKKAFMDCAERFAQLSSAKRAQVGCIIVKDDRIISIGYNGMPSGWTNECETSHTINDVPHMRQDYIAQGYIMHQGGDSITWTKQTKSQKYYMQKQMLLPRLHKVLRAVKTRSCFAHTCLVLSVLN